jgi:SOS-response transcriptional repressor LexA
MESYWDRVKSLLKKRKMSQETLAERINVSKFTLYSWIRNNTYPSVDAAVKMALTLGVSVEFLVSGEKPFLDQRPDTVIDKIENIIKEYKKIKSTDFLSEVKEPDPDYNVSEPVYGQFYLHEFEGEDMIVLPILGKTAAGMPIDAQETLQFPRRLLRGNDTDYFCLEVRGYSMTEAGIDDGDHVILRRTDVPENERIMLVQHEGQTTLKKLKIKNGVTFLCWEDGSNHAPIVVNSDGYTVQGALIHIIKTP